MVSVLGKLFGDTNEKAVKKILPVVEEINGFEEKIKQLSDAGLREKTEEFRDRLSNKETVDDLLAEAFGVAREMARRSLGQRPYDVQLIGGVVLHQGQIAEMKTGEPPRRAGRIDRKRSASCQRKQPRNRSPVATELGRSTDQNCRPSHAKYRQYPNHPPVWECRLRHRHCYS